MKSNKECQSADVLLFCETWLTEEGTSSENFEIDGFKSPIKVQGWNTHRGLVSYSKQKTKNSQKIVNEHFELMHLFFNAATLPCSIILFYRASDSDDVTMLTNFIESIIQDPRQKDKTIIVMGDANLDITNATDSRTLQYHEKMNNLNLTQLVSLPTTMHKSTLDHIWISSTNIDYTHNVRTTYYSDHMPLLLDII